MTDVRVTWFAALGLTAVFSAAIDPALADEPRLFKTDAYQIKAEVVADGLDHPWGLAFLPGGSALITERSGALRLLDGGKLGKPVEGVPAVRVGGQAGLFDVVLDPGFAGNGLIYLAYAEDGPDGAGTAVARGRLVRDSAGARLADVRVIFRQQPHTSRLQFGGRIVFMRDGTLLLTIGDGGDRDEAQNLASDKGKVIRIRTDGTIPSDNPFVGRDGVRPEIWSYGHRNPEGAALDPADGSFWTVEHGARGGDELNHPEAGKNYGWPVITYGIDYSGVKIGVGTARAGMEQPVHYWDPSIAPSGLALYQGALFPEWNGDALVGALKFQMLVRLHRENGKVVSEERMLKDVFGRIRDVREGPDGAVYLLTDESNGKLVRLTPAS